LVKLTPHHFSVRIQPGQIQPAWFLFALLGFSASYRPPEGGWFMVAFKFFEIQVIESDLDPDPLERRLKNHIAFLSSDPKRAVEQVASWAKRNDLKFDHGKWSDQELWFDLPDVFASFAMEIMHPDVLE
jgi:hypothetical protein